MVRRVVVQRRLPGDNAGGPLLVDGTLRRGTGSWTPAVHAVLRHLEERGFAVASRVLGIAAAGREMLTFLAGETVGAARPWPAWTHTDEALDQVGGGSGAPTRSLPASCDRRPATLAAGGDPLFTRLVRDAVAELEHGLRDGLKPTLPSGAAGAPPARLRTPRRSAHPAHAVRREGRGAERAGRRAGTARGGAKCTARCRSNELGAVRARPAGVRRGAAAPDLSGRVCGGSPRR